MTYSRKTVPVATLIARQPHRAAPANPATAHCALWLSPEQVEQAEARHAAAGRRLTGTVPCMCGNHGRRMYR